MSFTLISELLRKMLTDQNEEMLIEVRVQNCLYDQGRGLEAGRTLKTRIEYGTVKGTEEDIEIRLSGTVENHSGQKKTYTLYFFLWWNRTAFSLTKKGYNFNKTIKRQTLLFELGNTSELLYDSVFELDLYLEFLSSQRHFLYQGRGIWFLWPLNLSELTKYNISPRSSPLSSKTTQELPIKFNA